LVGHVSWVKAHCNDGIELENFTAETQRTLRITQRTAKAKERRLKKIGVGFLCVVCACSAPLR
jgi:hypothetical protein